MLDSAEFAFLSKTVLKLGDSRWPPLSRNRINRSSAETSLVSEQQTIDKTTDQTTNQRQATQPVLEAMTRLVEIVAELRSPFGGWPADLPKTSENLIPYVLDEAYDVLDAFGQSSNRASGASGAEEQRSRGAEAQGSKGTDGKNISPAPPHPCTSAQAHPSPLIVVDNLIPRLLWHLVSSSYDVMQLIGGVPAQILRSPQNPEIGLIRLVVGLSVWNSDHHWFIDLATHNVTSEPTPETPETGFLNLSSGSEIGFLNLSSGSWHKSTQKPGFSQKPGFLSPISAGQLITQLRQEIEFTSPELAKLMEPQSVEWLSPNHQWLSGFLQLTMDWEFLPQSPENSPEPEGQSAPLGQPIVADISESFPRSGLYGKRMLRLSQPAILQESAKIPFEETLIRILPQIQPESISDTGLETGLLEKNKFLTAENESLNSNLISELVTTAYDLVENWEFPWGDGEVLIDECMERLLWQTITSSYPMMQLIGSVEAMVLSPGEDWKIGILRLLAIFEIQVGNETITVDLSTGQSWEKHPGQKVLYLSPNTIVRFLDSGSLRKSPDTELSMQPLMVEQILHSLSQQIKANTPSFQWLMNGANIDIQNLAKNWESGLAQFRLELEFIPT